jgi:predicted nucleotidyltransferase
MTPPAPGPTPAHQIVIQRFVAACQDDERVIAAFLGGSYARGAADAYSDLDLYLITSDEGYAGFVADRQAFMQRLGTPLFLRDFTTYGFDLILFILADGTEGELGLGRASRFTHIHSGPHTVLLDKQGILAGAVFPLAGPPEAEQLETLRDHLQWFGHNLSHFITALGRGQVWAAAGALEDLRRACVNLARLHHDFAAPADGYEKLEQALPIEQLAPLAPTFVPLEPAALFRAAVVIVRFYQDLAPPLAQAHGLPHSAELDALMTARLAALGRAQGLLLP